MEGLCRLCNVEFDGPSASNELMMRTFDDRKYHYGGTTWTSPTLADLLRLHREYTDFERHIGCGT